LSSEFFENYDSNLITEYRVELGVGSNNPNLDTVAEVQEVIDQVNDEQSFEVLRTELKDAANQIERFEILDREFERVNSDWIAEYDTEFKVGTVDEFDERVDGGADTPINDREEIQAGIDDVNLVEATGEVDGAWADVDMDIVNEARDIVETWVKADDEGDTDKAAQLGRLDIAQAAIQAIEADSNAGLNTALNAFVEAEEAQVELNVGYTASGLDIDDVLNQWLADYRDAIETEAYTSVNDFHDSGTDIVDIVAAVNAEFHEFVVEDATVAASATAEPEFTITAKNKAGEVFTNLTDAPDASINVTIDGNQESYEASAAGNQNFTDATAGVLDIEPDGTDFDLQNVGEEFEVTIEFETDIAGGGAATYETKGQLTVVAGAIDAGESTVEADADEYTAGDDITLTVTLKDAEGNVVTDQNGPTAAVIEFDGSDTRNRTITFVDGVAEFVVQAREAGTDIDVTVETAGVTVTGTDLLTVNVGEASELVITPDTAADNFTVTVTDGFNTVTDFATTKIVNVTVMDDSDPAEEVDVTNADADGNVSVDFTAGVSADIAATSIATGYEITVIVEELDLTATKTVK